MVARRYPRRILHNPKNRAVALAGIYLSGRSIGRIVVVYRKALRRPNDTLRYASTVLLSRSCSSIFLKIDLERNACRAVTFRDCSGGRLPRARLSWHFLNAGVGELIRVAQGCSDRSGDGRRTVDARSDSSTPP